MLTSILQIFFAIVVGAVSLFLLWFVKFELSTKRRLLNRLPSLEPNYYVIGNALLFRGGTAAAFRNTISEFKRHTRLPLVIVWIGPFPRVSCLRPEAVEVLLSSTKWLSKAVQYDFLHPWLGLGLLTSTGEKWHKRRKMITPSFHFRILEDFVPIFHEQAEVLVSLIKEKQEAFDVYPYLIRCTLDVICETAMGCRIDAQRHDDSDYVKAINSISHIMKTRFFNPWYFMDVIFNLSSYGRQQRHCLKILHGFAYKVIKERRAEQMQKVIGDDQTDDKNSAMGIKKRVAFLDMLLQATVDGQPLTDEEIREEVDTFMFGGHDTTATTLGWALYNMGRFPEMQEKIFQEIHEHSPRDDEHSENRETSGDLKNLKYLDQFMKESMRLCPTAPFYGRQLNETAEICGYTIPAGVAISVNAYMLHRNPDHFPDPETFDPSRFSPENCANRHPFAYVPFSAGPRNCIGQKFASLEDKIIIVHLLRNFKITAVHKLEEMNTTVEMVLRPSTGFWLQFENRKCTE